MNNMEFRNGSYEFKMGKLRMDNYSSMEEIKERDKSQNENLQNRDKNYLNDENYINENCQMDNCQNIENYPNPKNCQNGLNSHNGQNCQNEKNGQNIPDQNAWVHEATSSCMQNLVKKYVYSTTYRDMIKDGAAGPVMVKTVPKKLVDYHKDPLAAALKIPEPQPIIEENVNNFVNWDRPQVRTNAGRCETMANCPRLGYDSYFQEHNLQRHKFARPIVDHDLPKPENIELAKTDMLRYPFDKMIPGHGGYKSFIAPRISKVKNVFDRTDPWEPVSVNQRDYIRFPKEVYENRVKPIKHRSSNTGFVSNPICTLSQTPLPTAYRLSPYLECPRYPTLVCDPNPPMDPCNQVPKEPSDNRDNFVCQPTVNLRAQLAPCAGEPQQTQSF